jgi:hypothetical protein
MALARRVLLLGLAAGVAACASTPDRADLAPWDQARVTAIAEQLAGAADAWWQAVREQPGGTPGSGTAQDYFQLQQNAQMLHRQATSLAAHLKAGDGYEKTVHSYQALREIVDDSQVEAQRAFLAKPAQEAWARVAGLVGQVAPYYDPRAAARPK